MTSDSINIQQEAGERVQQHAPQLRRLSAAEKAHCFQRACNAYESLWTGYVLENDADLQELKDANLPHSRPTTEKVIRDLMAQAQRPLADLRSDITRSDAEMDAELSQLGANTLPLEAASLHYTAGWQHIHSIQKHLAEQGEPLDKSRLLAPYANDGCSHLTRAAELKQLQPALEFLNAQGEQLTAQDLLTEAGTPAPLLQACIDSGEAPKLFCEQNWQGQPAEDLRRLRHALPEAQQQQIPNYHSLLNRLQSDAQTRQPHGR